MEQIGIPFSIWDTILVKQFVETGSELVFEILFILVCMPKFVHDFEI